MTARSYDYWVLDLDGTLVDVEPDYVHEVMGRIGDRLGYGFTDEQAEQIWHSLGGDPNAALESWGLNPELFWKTFHEVENPDTRAEATFLYDDAGVCADIDRPLALVTHCQSYLTDPVLDRLDIGDWFDTVVCCTDETGWKPNPAPIELALTQIDARTEGKGILVGDGPHDVGAAWNAGLDAAHVERHGHHRRGMCVLGDHRIERFDELWNMDAAAD
jgi:phosphoglycolate phosphatase